MLKKLSVIFLFIIFFAFLPGEHVWAMPTEKSDGVDPSDSNIFSHLPVFIVNKIKSLDTNDQQAINETLVIPEFEGSDIEFVSHAGNLSDVIDQHKGRKNIILLLSGQQSLHNSINFNLTLALIGLKTNSKLLNKKTRIVVYGSGPGNGGDSSTGAGTGSDGVTFLLDNIDLSHGHNHQGFRNKTESGLLQMNAVTKLFIRRCKLSTESGGRKLLDIDCGGRNDSTSLNFVDNEFYVNEKNMAAIYVSCNAISHEFKNNLLANTFIVKHLHEQPADLNSGSIYIAAGQAKVSFNNSVCNVIESGDQGVYFEGSFENSFAYKHGLQLTENATFAGNGFLTFSVNPHQAVAYWSCNMSHSFTL